MGIQKVKDSRPLTDKTYQRDQTVKLLDFLRANGYGNMALTTKNFPLSGKEFVNIFNFLYSFLDPATVNRPVIPTVKFEETVVKIMKDLHYPGNIAKSNFVALGSSHAWPTVLGTLEYLLNLAKIYRYGSKRNQKRNLLQSILRFLAPSFFPWTISTPLRSQAWMKMGSPWTELTRTRLN